MCENLSRGKRKDNGKWVEGYYVCLDKYHYILTGKLDITKGYPNFAHYEVIPETVGRCTGLEDKNSTRIFEGDIVKHFNGCPIAEYSEDVGRIFYYTETSRFLRTSKLFPDDCPELFSCCEYEVIGNIHDNPELLKSDV